MSRGCEFWDTERVCEYLGIRPRTLYRYVASGQLRAYKVGHRNFFVPADVSHFVVTGGRRPSGGRAGC